MTTDISYIVMGYTSDNSYSYSRRMGIVRNRAGRGRRSFLTGLTGFTGFKGQDLGYRGLDLGNDNRIIYRDGQDIEIDY